MFKHDEVEQVQSSAAAAAAAAQVSQRPNDASGTGYENEHATFRKGSECLQCQCNRCNAGLSFEIPRQHGVRVGSALISTGNGKTILMKQVHQDGAKVQHNAIRI